MKDTQTRIRQLGLETYNKTDIKETERIQQMAVKFICQKRYIRKGKSKHKNDLELDLEPDLELADLEKTLRKKEKK